MVVSAIVSWMLYNRPIIARVTVTDKMTVVIVMASVMVILGIIVVGVCFSDLDSVMMMMLYHLSIGVMIATLFRRHMMVALIWLGHWARIGLLYHILDWTSLWLTYDSLLARHWRLSIHYDDLLSLFLSLLLLLLWFFFFFFLTLTARLRSFC